MGQMEHFATKPYSAPFCDSSMERLYCRSMRQWIRVIILCWGLIGGGTSISWATQWYPLYEGSPPRSTHPDYQRDVDASRAAGATVYNLPLYFEPQWSSSDPKIGVLIIHGYGAGPMQNLEIQKWWFQHNVASYALRLDGHGISLDRLKASTVEDWQRSIEGPLAFLKSRCDTVFIYGLSTGAPLAITTAARHPEVAGILVQAPIIKSADDRFYSLSPIVGAADILGIDVGQQYIENDGTSTHYWIPYCVFRGAYQVQRSAAHAMRELPKITVPVMAFACPTDHVADPESSDIIARRSNSPWMRTYWFGTTHTPMISPNITIYQETLRFFEAVTQHHAMADWITPTSSIPVTHWGTHPTGVPFDSVRIHLNSTTEAAASLGVVGTDWDGTWGLTVQHGELGGTLWQDRLDSKLAPTFGTFYEVSATASGFRARAEGYLSLGWQWASYVTWDSTEWRVATRVPVASRPQDLLMILPEIGISNGRFDSGVSLIAWNTCRLTYRYTWDTHDTTWSLTF